MKGSTSLLHTVVAVALVIGGAAGVRANISNTVFALEAVNDSGTSTFSVDFSQGSWDPGAGVYTWSLAAPLDLVDDTVPSISVATLDSATLTIHTGAAPDISLNLGVVGGESDTDFYVDTARVSFPTIPASSAEANFAASAAVWDNQTDGAYLMGNGDPGVGAFRSYYNGVHPGGSVFSHLISVVWAGGGGSYASQSGSYPDSGMAPFGSDVDDISVYAGFVVSAGDRAVGDATFGVVPEPGSLALTATLGAMCATILWRRRRGC